MIVGEQVFVVVRKQFCCLIKVVLLPKLSPPLFYPRGT